MRDVKRGNAHRRVPPKRLTTWAVLAAWTVMALGVPLLTFGAALGEEDAQEIVPLFAREPDEPGPVDPEMWALLLQNQDAVGWLEAGDAIRLPVARRDNAHYLSHDFQGRASVNGAAFMDEHCRINPPDEHILIYGHNMRSGAVFGTLRRFRDIDYLKAHCVVTFNSLYRRDYYVPFAVFEFSAEPDNPAFFNICRFSFDSDADFSAYVAAAAGRAMARLPIDVATGDRLLTLVTCSYGVDNGRLAVMCRALREGETPETVRARANAR